MSTDFETQLSHDMGEMAHDPLRHVMYSYPWGEPGTPLADYEGPDDWQIEILCLIRDGLATVDEAIQIAVASGHGVGKSTLVAWIILWSMSTFPDTKGVVTANTETQLRTKTWPELAKWHQLFIARHWFGLTATALISTVADHDKTWRIDAIAWSERNTEAFAGLHNQGKRVVLIFDEASAIPDVIFETAEGALTDTDTEIIWAVFGNPTRNTGRFRECWGKFRHRWKKRQVDSRTAKMANKAQLASWVADYGEDSDFVRVRVRGVFPRAGSMQFISADLVAIATSPARDPDVTFNDPLIIGVDVARFGDDQSVIAFRRGPDCRAIPWLKYRGIDTVALEAQVAAAINRYHPDAVFIDEGGVGGGVVDHLRARHFPVTGVMFGGKADRALMGRDGDVSYANKRAEMWGHMKAWLDRGALPADPEIETDLTGVEYGYTLRDGRDAIILEKKEDMKRRGLASPDSGDALCLTFAYPVAPSDHRSILGQQGGQFQAAYNPMDQMWSKQQSEKKGQREPWMPFQNR